MDFKQFLKDTKRLFEPALVNKWMFVRGIFMYSLIWGYAYFNVYIIKAITSEIEQGNINGYKGLFIFFVTAVR